ncbi:hypothetical protein [Streptomyces sp. SCL15-4]|uniref:hypothetical protein n=1 Tax=Streptomyces sp. SCL15-4 TaxID=2967221 RepID=UPI00296770A5|nr:hypothetical protein [Streptomyces sp. SCL15-4]
MKLGHAVAVAVLLAPIPFAGMTDPAAAAAVHIVTVKVELIAKDGPPFWDMKRITPPRKNITLDHSKRTRSVTFEVCADGAIAVLKLRATLLGDEKVAVRPNLLLYDGPPCSSNDLAASVYPSSQVIAGGTGKTGWEIHLPSEKFASFDYAHTSIDVSHNLWP